MTNLQTIADQVEITALQAEYTDAGLMRDWDRLAALFTEDGAWRMPHIPAEFESRKEIREAVERLQNLWEYFIQNTHAGKIHLNGDTATGRAHIMEFGRMHDGNSFLNYALYHDHYQRTPEGWKFKERTYEIRYLDTTPLTGKPPTKQSNE